MLLRGGSSGVSGRENVSGVAEGVAKLHALSPQPIVHRDLKAANVLLSTADLATAVPKVCDFGVATVVQQTMASMSGSGALAGTPAWKAPETFAGDYTAASDCFALAVIDFELVTRQEPWAGLEEPFSTKCQ